MMAFLCGGMEYSPDGGREWRRRMRVWVEEKFGHRVFDPIVEAERILTAEEQQELPGWKLSDPERFRKTMRFIINHDLDVMAQRADYVICNWDQAAMLGGGTQAEVTAACRKGIPIYVVTEMPEEKVSGWVLACADRVCGNFDQLKELLASVYGKDPRQKALDWKMRVA
jgi:nucleoside 2-deoxyribosyltransferase